MSTTTSSKHMIRLKTKQDLEIMREGGKRHAEILHTLAKLCTPGTSTLVLEEALRLVKEGGDKPTHLNYTPRDAKRPFPAALCISINDEIVHGIPNEPEKIMNDGDIVTIDLSLTHKGLITDSAITVPVGAIDDESRELLKVTREALEAGIKAAQPGAHIGDIGQAINARVEESKFKLAEDLVGHGVGFELHEDPYVPNVGVNGEGEELIPGMVIAIEPMLNVGSGKIKLTKDGYTIKTKDGSRSAHFEHTVAITAEGNIILTL